MTLPPAFTLAVDCPQGGDLSGLIFFMTVTSGTKNPYYIFFSKTSSDGKTCLTAEAFRGQFKDHGDIFIMDYSGSVEAASDVVTFKLYDPRLMLKEREQFSRRPLSKYERTIWKSRREFVDYMLSCRNLEFEFEPQLIRIPVDGTIQLTVTRKTETAN